MCLEDNLCHTVCQRSSDCAANEACIDSACQEYAQTCTAHNDCVDAQWYCSSIDDTCHRFPTGNSTCNDGVHAGDETDVDCGGSCPPCNDGQTCGTNRDCRTDLCTNDVCQPTCTDGYRNGDESDTDCGGSCSPCAIGRRCEQAGDCRTGVCEINECQVPSCGDSVENGSETDLDCGGPCDPCAEGAHCLAAEDCVSGVCASETCQAPTCSDSVKNGDEGDLDCGASCPQLCGQGYTCNVPGDCGTDVCAGGRCVAASCNDTVQNGDESDVDCGGACAACADGRTCNLGADCASLVCAGACQTPTCSDSAQNGDETDMNCGGSCPSCADGLNCSVNSNCVSGVCSLGKCSPCPADMVQIGTQLVCVDRFEATIYGSPSCTGVQYGQLSDDYPAGFPDLVESANCTGTCWGSTVVAPSVDLYACSLAGVRPSRLLSWYPAQRACENVSKRLCSGTEWYDACRRGSDDLLYPYDNAYDGSACNGQDVAIGDTVPTATFAACEGGYPLVFDMSGNVAEWTSECSGIPSCEVRGGSYGSIESWLHCYRTSGTTPSLDNSSNRGFRCCKDL